MYRHFGEIVGSRVASKVAQRAVLWAGMALWTVAPVPASAQGTCPADAGSCPDAGAPPTLGATGPDGGGSGGDAGSALDGVGGSLCSCETLDDADGRLHLCTDSYERDVCEQFSCASGTERTRACPSRGVQLCCEMPNQGTQSRLYDDCTHPNCESGFRDQCADFRGTVHEGDCDVSAKHASPKKNSLCAVARPGARGGTPWPWVLSCAGLARLSLRRRRAA